jgi:hypothetical protein
LALKCKYRPFPFQGHPKFTQIGIFGLKTYHLATLLSIPFLSPPKSSAQKKMRRKTDVTCHDFSRIFCVFREKEKKERKKICAETLNFESG